MSRMCRFDLLFEEWQSAETAAAERYRLVWQKLNACSRGAGPPPSEAEIAQAARCRAEAAEWLLALQDELQRERCSVEVL
jgi:hypothetical protein